MFKENKFAPIFWYKGVIPNKTKHASQLLKTALLVINAHPSRIYAHTHTHTHLHLYLCIFSFSGVYIILKVSSFKLDFVLP